VASISGTQTNSAFGQRGATAYNPRDVDAVVF